MAGNNDVNTPEVIQRYDLDFTKAIDSIANLNTALEGLNTKLREIQTSAGTVAQQVLATFNVTQQAATAATTTTTNAVNEQVRTTEQSLARLESRLMGVLNRVTQTGAVIPGLDINLGDVRAYRDYLAADGELTEDMQANIAVLQNFAAVAEANTRILTNEIALLQTAQQGYVMLGEAAERSALAEQLSKEALNRLWDADIARQEQERQALIARQWSQDDRVQAQLQRQQEVQARAEMEAYRALVDRINASEREVPQIITKISKAQELLRVNKINNQELTTELSLLRQIGEAYKQNGLQIDESDLSLFNQYRDRVNTLYQRIQQIRNDMRMPMEPKEVKLANPAVSLNAMLAESATLDTTLTKNTMLNSIYAQQNDTLRQQLQTLLLKYQTEGQLTEAEREQLAIYKEQLTILGSQTTVAIQEKKQKTYSNNVMADQFERRASWFFAGSVFFGIINMAKQATAAINQVEYDMMQIARVTDDANFSIEKMRGNLLDLAVQYGMEWKKVSDIAIRFSQAGYNSIETLRLTESALLALRSAELDAQAATEGFIAIMAQWDMEATQLEPTLDKINKVADDFAVSSQDLVDGLSRSSGAARNMGMTLEDTIAVLTVMREVTGRTGKEIGNALNSILSFMQRSQSIKAFENLGINVWADEAATSFRNVMDVFGDLAAKWQDPSISDAAKNSFVNAAEDAGLFNDQLASTLGVQNEYRQAVEATTKAQATFTDAQKRDAAQAAAGTYRRNYLIALLNSWANVDKVLIAMEDSLGYSQRETARSAETLEYKYGQLKAATTELYVSMGEAGLKGVLADIAGGMASAITAFNSLDKGFRDVILNAVILTASFKGISALLSMAGLSGKITAVTSAIGNLSKALIGLKGAEAAGAALGTSILALGNALVPIIAVLGGAAILTWILNQREAAKATELFQSQAGKQANELERLKEKYIGLAGIQERTAVQESEFQSVTEELVSIVPNAITGFDNMGRALTDVGTAAQAAGNQVKFLREQHAAYVKVQADLARVKLEPLEKQLDSEQALFDEMRSKSLPSTRVDKMTQSQDSWIPFKGIYDFYKYRGMDDVQLQTEVLGDITKQGQKVSDIIKEIAVLKAALKEEEALQAMASSDPSTSRDTSAGFKTPPGGTKDIREFITLTRESADVLAQESAAIERQITWKQAKIEWYSREGASIEDQITAMKLQGQVTQDLQAKQASVQREWEAVSTAIGVLTAKQRTVNLTTEDGIDAYRTLGSEIANLSQRAGQLSEEWWKLNQEVNAGMNGLQRVRAERQIEIDSAERTLQYLKDTDANPAQITGVETTLRDLYTSKQAELNNKIREQQTLLTVLNSAYASGEIGVAAYNQQSVELETTIADLQGELQDYSAKLHNLTKESYAAQKAYDDHSRAIEHWGTLGVWNTERQIEELRKLRTMKELTVQEQWKLDEQIAGKYLNLLGEVQKQVEKAYNERIDWIEQEADRKIKAKQRELDALDEQQTGADREDTTRKHQEKLLKLIEQRRYHELRTGAEHAKAIEDIDKQLAEENISWQKQQTDWARDDRKKSLRDQIQEIKDAAEQEKKQWESKYKEMQAAFETNNAQMLALSATFDPKWFDDARNKAQQWIDGFKSLRPAEVIAGYLSNIGLPSSLQGLVQPTGKFTDLLLPKAHSGASVLSYGAAILKPGELVFPPALSSQLRSLITVLSSRPSLPMAANGGVHVHGNLFNAEKVALSDELDVDIVGRKLSRSIAGLRRG